MKDIDLSVRLGNLRLKNPLISSAGPIGGTADNIKNCADAGFGAVITKTVNRFPNFRRYPRPHYYIYNQHMSSRQPRGARPDNFGWLHIDRNSQYPPEKFAEFIKESAGYCRDRDCLLIGSISGSGVDQWEEMAHLYEDAGAGALELNFCCPYPQTMASVSTDGTEHLIGATFGEMPELGITVIERLKKTIKIPIYTKMPPTMRNKISDISAMYHHAGSDGISFYANSMALKVDIETGEPLGYGVAIGSSHGHLMDTMADVAKVAKEVPGFPILAGRGVRYWDDVIELLMAGAGAVETSIAIMVNGLGYVKEMLTNIEQWMDRKGYGRISDLQGIVLPKLCATAEIKDHVGAFYAQVDGRKCVACGRCEDVCWFNGAHLYTKNGKGAAKIEREHCVGCTACAQVCPAGAISIHDRSDEEYQRALFASTPDYEFELM